MATPLTPVNFIGRDKGAAGGRYGRITPWLNV